MKRRLTAVAMPAAILTLIGPAAWGSWTSDGGGLGSVSATSVNVGNDPTASRIVTSADEGSVELQWASSTLASGGPVTHYDVVRHLGSETTTVCTAVTGTSCVDPTPVPGPVTYAVVPRVGTYWTGPESTETDFQYDEFAPTTSIERQPDGAEWTNETVHIKLKAQDPGPVESGVKEIHYSINGDDAVVVASDTAEFDVTEEMQNTITFWSVDHLGNVETPNNSANVNIDRTAPVPHGQLVDGKVTLWATDSGGSGLAYIEYRIGQSGSYELYPQDTQINLPEGQTIYFRAVDGAGNESPVESLTNAAPVVDTEAPATKLESAPLANAAGWTRENTTLTLRSTDNVGVTKLEWRVGSTGPVTTLSGSGPYTLGPFTAEGTTNVQYRAFDAADNHEDWMSHDVKIDKTAPALSVTFPVDGGTYGSDNDFRKSCGTNGTHDVCGSVVDNGSGVEAVRLKLAKGATCQADNGTFSPEACATRRNATVSGDGVWSWITGNLGPGSYTLTVWATDSAGNEASREITFTR